MKQLSFISTFILVFLLVIFIQPAMAYVGPGTGIAAVGAFIAIAVGVIAAIFGFLWFPIKRMLRKRKQAEAEKAKAGEAE